MSEKEELVYCDMCEYGNSYSFDEYDADAWCDKEKDEFDIITPVKCDDYIPKRKFKGRYGYDISDNFVDKEGEYSFNDEDTDYLVEDVIDLLNKQDEEIKELKYNNTKLLEYVKEINRHLNDNEFEFKATENRMELFKDELYVKDTHTRIEMIKGRRLKITLYPPKQPPISFCYYITGKINIMEKLY